jgi:signal transduction histidine kinase
MKLQTICFIFLLISSSPAAKSSEYHRKTDSLHSFLQQRNTVFEGHIICQIGSLHYRNFQFKEGLKMANEALVIGHNTQNEKLIIRAHRLLADIYYAMAEYELSLKHFFIELEYHKKNGNLRKIAEVHCNIGVVYDVKGFVEKGLYHYLRALRLYELVDDKEGLVATLSNLAHIYREQRNYAEAIRHFSMAAEIEREFLDNQKPHYFLVNIGEDYMHMKEYERAAVILEEADSLLRRLPKPDDEDLLIWTDKARVQGIISMETEQYKKALEYFTEALNIVRQTGYLEKEGPVLILLGSLLTETGELISAKTYLEQAQSIAIETGSFTMQRDVYKSLSMLSEKLGMYSKALEYFKLFNQANDSVINIESARRMSEMQVTFETEKKEAQIRLLQQENEIQHLLTQKSENQRRLAVIAAVALLLIAGLYFNRYRLKKQSAALLSEKNDQLAGLNATKDKFFAILAHDLKNPVSSFSNISTLLKDKLEYLNENDLRYYLTEMSNSAESLNQLLLNLLQWARSQRNQLNIELKEHNTSDLISKALRFLKTETDLKQLTIHQNKVENITLHTDDNIMITLLRNVIGNAVKFSPDGSEISVTASKENGRCIISVCDMGPGMQAEDIEKLFRTDVNTRSIGNHSAKGTGLGLILCSELLEKIGGSIRAESVFGQGSTFFIEVPGASIHSP